MIYQEQGPLHFYFKARTLSTMSITRVNAYIYVAIYEYTIYVHQYKHNKMHFKLVARLKSIA